MNREVIHAIRARLHEEAAPERAAGAQAYMKSAMPFLGVSVPDVRRLTAAAAARHPFVTAADLRATVLELWRTAEFREERYAAIDLTGNRLVGADLQMLAVYEEIIRHGAWWDYTDAVAGRICRLLQEHRAVMSRAMLQWSIDPDVWIRRAAITSQLKARANTDPALLASVIEANLADPDFFVRKAIGWALREYARTAPNWVADFVSGHEESISPLSRREALKHLPK